MIRNKKNYLIGNNCISLVYLLFVLCLQGACAQQPIIESCAGDIMPIRTVAPILPARLHNEYEGYAIVYLVVDTDGTVLEAAIKEEEWKPLGNSRGKPIGYREEILEAVLKNKYSLRSEKCFITSRLIFTWKN